jgi:hypothetical protein
MAPVTQRGDALLARVLQDGNEASANELLNEFFADYPIERLRFLLESDDDHAVRAGAWIASELGSRVEPLIEEVAKLLKHQSRYVRFFALDSVLMGASPGSARTLARAVQLVEDPDVAVRWKAMGFLANASREQLAASARHLGQSQLGESVRWLLQAVASEDTHGIESRLADEGATTRLFAGVAAARLAPTNPSALRRAARASDPEVSSFATERLAQRP